MTAVPPDTRSWFDKGFDAYPERHNYPQAGTVSESDWLAGWYAKQREVELAKLSPDMDSEALAGRNSFAAQYNEDSDAES